MSRLESLTAAMTWKFLLSLTLVTTVTGLFCAAWAWAMLYIDQVCHDSQHVGLCIGFSLGLAVPLGAAALAIWGAYVLADEL